MKFIKSFGPEYLVLEIWVVGSPETCRFDTTQSQVERKRKQKGKMCKENMLIMNGDRVENYVF